MANRDIILSLSTAGLAVALVASAASKHTTFSAAADERPITDPGHCVGPGCAPHPGTPVGRPAAAAIPPMIDPRGIVVPGTCVGPGCAPAPGTSVGNPAAAAVPPIFDPRGIVVPGTSVGHGSPVPPKTPTGKVAPMAAGVLNLTPNNSTQAMVPDVTIESGSIVIPGAGMGARGTGPTIIIVPAASTPASPAGAGSPEAEGGLRHGASPQSFDSGLSGCDTPFDQLATPRCIEETKNSGRRCEQYSRSQFTEIVEISVFDPANNQWKTHCSGTLMSPHWVLTAAHCLIGTNSAASQGAKPDKDLIIDGDELQGLMVSADNIMTLAGGERDRKVARAIVYGRYGGLGPINGVHFSDDLALLELDSPYPAEAIEPARIASPGGFLPEATIAGYGFSNADNGTIGRFNLTWPPLLQKTGTQFQFVPGQDSAHKSAFCQGDSGGPVLVGRNRGCRRTDKIPEYRPRYVQGIISYNMLGRSQGDSQQMRAATACMSANYMAMQDVTLKERRDWICAATGLEAGGC